jgi:hypothetical protein
MLSNAETIFDLCNVIYGRTILFLLKRHLVDATKVDKVKLAKM